MATTYHRQTKRVPASDRSKRKVMASPVRSAREADVHSWLLEQAKALRAQQQDLLDWGELAEELEDMAARDRREVRKLAQKLLLHLLKRRYQSKELHRRAHSWRKSINEARDDLADLIQDMPSLGGHHMTEDFLPKAYARARRDARDETGLSMDRFPAECPWTFDEIMRDGFFPDSTST